MKKSILLIVTICILVFSLLGCNNSNNEKNNEILVNLTDVYNLVINAQPENVEELVLLEETSEDYIEELYTGLKDISLEEKKFYVHPIGIACEIAMVKVENDADIEKIESIFKNRIDKGINSIMCDTDSQDIWRRRAQVQTKGKYVCMIVLPDEYIIPSDVFMQNIDNK